MTEKITFHLSAFDGPLDLLLHLIAKNKVNIYDIPISLILEQYMEILHEAQSADMEVAGDFIAMAAQLMLIKSRMLLPKEKNEEDEEEDPRAMLVEQLLEYQRIREVQPYFKRHSDAGRDILTRPPEPLERKKTFEGTLPPEKLSEAADYLLATEAADAGAVLLSRAQEASAAEMDATVAHLNRALKQVGCSRRLGSEIIRGNWFEFTDKDFERLLHAGYQMSDYCKEAQQEDAFDSLFFMHVKMTEGELKAAVQSAFSDPACGHIFRIKGFLPMGDGWLELNATRQETLLKPISRGQEILIVIGEGLSKKALQKYFQDSEND